MRRTIFPILVALTLWGCAGSFSPVIEDEAGADDGSGLDGAADDDTADAADDGSDTGSDPSDGASGGSTDAGDDGSDTNPNPGDGPDSDDGSDAGEPPTNPGPLEPCDPLLTAQGMQTCESPADDPRTYTCTPVVVDKTLGPEFADVWGFRCAVLDDTQGDGSDWGDFCNPGEWRTAESWTNGCQESLCLTKFSNPPNPGLGQVILPDALCEVNDPEVPGATACCTEMCEVGAQGSCGAGMKCIPYGAMSLDQYLEDGAPLMGACVAEDYDPAGP